MHKLIYCEGENEVNHSIAHRNEFFLRLFDPEIDIKGFGVV
jgi:hypothetical protein